jgi:hypothetical protein
MGPGERLSPEKINDMWKSGYCPTLIEHAKTTDLGPMGAVARTSFLEIHIKVCRDCFHATVMKTVQGNAAELMGAEAMACFQTGGDITKLSGFQEAMQNAVRGLLKSKYATDRFFDWWRVVVSRIDYEKEASRGQEAN